MGTWTLIQIVFDIFLAVGLFLVVMRMSRAPKDDPRLSRGLQLLQSKISVLEDLSDRTEIQVNQLAAILENKAREVQAKVQLAEQHVQEIRVSMERSLEVAKIFQDKIPHQEIIERQNTIKYVQAARLAHQGISVDEIARQVDLPKGEVEFIASVNRDRLMFSEEQLPEWALQTSKESSPSEQAEVASPTLRQPQFSFAQAAFSENASAPLGDVKIASSVDSADRLRAEMELAEHARLVESLSRLQFEMQNLDLQLARENGGRDLTNAFEVPKVETASLQKLGEEFRKAVDEAKREDQPGILSTLFQKPPAHSSQQFSRAVESGSGLEQVAAPSQVQAAGKNANQTPFIESLQRQEAPPDQGLARALAQAKVQAALRSGESTMNKSTASRELSPEPSPELIAAREVARGLAKDMANNVTKTVTNTVTNAVTNVVASQPIHIVNGRGKKGPAPVVKKVVFPRVDGSDPLY